MDRDEQANDIIKSLSYLNSFDLLDSQYTMCYPYGAFNENTLDLMTKYGFFFGLCLGAEKVDLNKNNRFTISRFDTNDFPKEEKSNHISH